jgi:hypothetical protein
MHSKLNSDVRAYITDHYLYAHTKFNNDVRIYKTDHNWYVA